MRSFISRESAAPWGAVLAALLCVAPAGADIWNFHGPTDCGGDGCSGRIRSIVVDPANSNHLYAGHAGGGLWESTDAGNSWSHLFDGAIGAVALVDNATGSDRLLVGRGTDSWVDNGIWSSTDGGATWNHALPINPSEGIHFERISVSSDRQRVYAATNKGIYASTDGGASWSTTRQLDGRPVTDVVAHPTMPLIVIAGVQNSAVVNNGGIFRSTNGGSSWSSVGHLAVSDPDDWGPVLFAWPPSEQTSLYALVLHRKAVGSREAWTVKNIVKSEAFVVQDVGVTPTWSVVWSDGHCAPGSTDKLCDFSEGLARCSFAVSDTDPDYLMAGAVHVYRSTTGGSVGSWGAVQVQVGTHGYHADVHDLVSDSEAFWMATDGGVFRCVEDVSVPASQSDIEPRNDGLESLELYNIAIDPATRATGIQAYGASQDQGSWTQDYENAGEWSKYLAGDGVTLEASDQCVGCSPLGSDNRVIMTTNYSPGYHVYLQCDAFGSAKILDAVGQEIGSDPMVDPDNPALFFWFTNDGGQAKLNHLEGTCAITVSHTAQCGSPASAAAIAATTTGPRRIYFACGVGGVYRLVETGSGWTETALAVPGSLPWGQMHPVSDIVVHPGSTESTDQLFVTLGHKAATGSSYSSGGSRLWKYSQATGWVQLGNGQIPNVPALSVAVDPADPNQLFVGLINGIYGSSNGGTTWTSAQFELPVAPVTDLDYHTSSGTLFAATYGRSIWSSYPTNWRSEARNGVVAPVDASRETTGRFKTDGGTLSFVLDQPAEVVVRLYDVQGRAVDTFASDPYPAGIHELRTDFSNLPDGMYFARLVANGVQLDVTKFVVRAK